MSDNVTVTEAARRLGVDKALVSRQVRRFCLMGADKRFSLSAYEHARATSLQVTMRRDRPIDAGLLAKVVPESTEAPPASPTVVSAVTEHKQLQAEMLRLQIAKERGELVNRADVEEGAMTSSRIIRDALLAFPARVGQELGMVDVATATRVLRERINQLLADLAAAHEAKANEDQLAA